MDIQTLMDEFYAELNAKGLSQEDLFRQTDALHKAAVQLGNLNYQVYNGGFSQWIDNGYADAAKHDLIKLARRGVAQGIKGFDALLPILVEVEPLCVETTVRVTCGFCGGSGYTEIDGEDEDEPVEGICDNCSGRGKVDEENLDHEALSRLSQAFYALGDMVPAFEELIARFDEQVEIPEPPTVTPPPEPSKPPCKLIGTDGNVFAVIVAVSTALRKAGLRDQAEEFRNRAFAANSYTEVLGLTTHYVSVY